MSADDTGTARILSQYGLQFGLSAQQFRGRRWEFMRPHLL